MFQLDSVIDVVGGEKTGEQLEWIFSEQRRKKERLTKAFNIRREDSFLDIDIKCYGINPLTGIEGQDVIEGCVSFPGMPAQHVYFSNGKNIICPQACLFLNHALNCVKLTTGAKLYGGVSVEKIDIYGKLSFIGVVVPVLGNIRVCGVYMKALKSIWAKI